MFSVEFVSITQGAGKLLNRNAQDVISYIARVSNEKNQLNFDTAPKLLKYCMDEKHWSPFQMADMTLEIVTSRAIADQIFTHKKAFDFQQFSQRYAEVTEIITYPARRQDKKNRQNSIDDLEEETKDWFQQAQANVYSLMMSVYKEAIRRNIAKELARFVLPLSSQTKLYMKGSVRSWIHYIQLRTGNGTQKEHQDIALAAKVIFCEQFPDMAKALEWI